MNTAPLVYVVDDNAELRESLALLLSTVGLEAMGFASADEFLGQFRVSPERPVCLLLDLRMPGMSGIALLERLRADKVQLPTIIITGHGDMDTAVRAMKLGAIDFLTKPFNSQQLLDLVQDVLRQHSMPPVSPVERETAAARLETLTPRERQIFDYIVSGASNKAIALNLGCGIRTIETHRAKIMKKLNARHLVDLVHLSVALK